MSLVIKTNEWRYAYPMSADMGLELRAYEREAFRVVSYVPQSDEFAVMRFSESHKGVPCGACDGVDDECQECMHTLDLEEDDETAERWAASYSGTDATERENARIILSAMARAKTMRPVAQNERAA